MMNTNVANSSVEIIREIRANGQTRYGVTYCIGRDRAPDAVLFKYNSVCDSIAFFEHYREVVGKYPEMDPISISKGRVHTVTFENCPIETAKRTAAKMCKLLRVQPTCTFSVLCLSA